MKTIHRIVQLCFLVVALMLNSCADNSPFGISEEGGYKSTLVFNVAQAKTRTIIPEDDVKRVDILLFKEGILEKVMKNVTSFGSSPDGYSSVNIYFDTEGVRTAYVVANNDNESWLNTLVPGETTEESVGNFRTATLLDMAATPLVMYGISDEIRITAGQSTALCKLYRVVAKIGVNNKATNFRLTSVRLLNSKVASGIFPGTAADVKMADFTKVATEEGSVFLYTYENDVLEMKNATAVEIEGEVNGAQLTDTIHFTTGDKLLALERNYFYTIHINDVKKNNVVAVIDVNPWEVGGDITEVVSGNRPTVDVRVEPAVGTYSKNDSTLTIVSDGGKFSIDVKANAECDLEFSEGWLKSVLATRAASFIGSTFNVQAEKNAGTEERTGEIRIINKISKLARTVIVKQGSGQIVADKYMVLVVAGQSNAVGYDQSALDAEDLVTPDRAWQLSYRNGTVGKENLSIIPLKWCADDVDTYKSSGRNESGQYGLKGIHLPLAKELLKSIPADYNIVVVPVAYASSRFAASNGYGTYNSTMKRPNEMSAYLRWGEQSAYNNTIVDRVKHLLDMDARNKFLGVVWCQGENDCANSDYQYTEFTKMAEGILRNLNNAGYGNRSNYGAIDKRSWYTYSSCSYWVDWYSGEDASAVFGGYKAWNPDTYIHVPFDLPSNPEGGFGMGKYHFGKNAYRQIAGMVAERMNQNGLLFNGTAMVKGHFTDMTTQAQAAAQGGSLEDGDVKSSLLLMLPFENSTSEKIGSASVFTSNMSLGAADGLKDINGESIIRNALKITPQGGYCRVRGLPAVTDWTMSFMFKRTGNFNAGVQAIVSPSGLANAPFIGFRKYSSVMGVAKAAEFVIEPIRSGTKLKAVPGQFMGADKVRSLDEWVHYMITYNHSTKETSVYMNGELVQKKAIVNSSAVDFSTVYIGNISSDSPAAEGLLMDFGLWNKVLAPQTLRKIFLMSYYGYTK